MERKNSKGNAFPPCMEKSMGGFQDNPKRVEWNMRGFMSMNEWQGLKEQELFYRATDYRGS